MWLPVRATAARSGRGCRVPCAAPVVHPHGTGGSKRRAAACGFAIRREAASDKRAGRPRSTELLLRRVHLGRLHPLLAVLLADDAGDDDVLELAAAADALVVRLVAPLVGQPVVDGLVLLPGDVVADL